MCTKTDENLGSTLKVVNKTIQHWVVVRCCVRRHNRKLSLLFIANGC